jgi:serine/threonine protein kinase
MSAGLAPSLACWSQLTGSSNRESSSMAPEELHSCFDPKWVKPWQPGRFVQVHKLQDAPRNSGQVLLMQDTVDGCKVAVKKIPMAFFGTSQADFLAKHGDEEEHPWRDLGCSTFLSSVGYEHVCNLHGVFQDAEFTYVVMSWATEGDLQSWCVEHRPYSDANAEQLILPLVLHIFESVAQLHNHSIVHGDLSLENVVTTCDSVRNEEQVKLIDFGMASSQRFCRKISGKSMYMAPEILTREEYDGFLADTFAVGIMVFALTVGAYPWTSTKPGACRRFGYFCEHGLEALLGYISKHDNLPSATRMSEELKHLLSGLLAVNPYERLTLGERVYGRWRRSVWQESWVTA